MLDTSDQDAELVPSASPNGEALTVEQAIANLNHEDLSLRYYAAWWLGKFNVRTTAAIDGLIKALADESDRTELGGYPLRRNAARALGKLGDQRAVPQLIHCLDCSDFYVRKAAAIALGMLGDPVAIQPLMQLLAETPPDTQLASGKPDLGQPVEAVLEALGMLRATAAVPLIQGFLQYPVQRVQYVAARALYQLTHDSAYGELLVKGLKNSDIKLRRVVLTDLGASGYLPAAKAITESATENSFKLIALKGLLEQQLSPEQPQLLSEDAIKVMTLMDSLL